MFGTKSVCLTFSIFLFVFFGEMYVPFLDGSFIYGYFEFGGMVALVGWKRTKSRLRRKKTAPDAKKWRIVCIKGGMSLPVVTCHNRPPQKKSRQGDGIPGLVLAYFGRMD